MSSGLFHTLGIGTESLLAARQGVDTASHNIANAHTEGFSKQRVNVNSRHPNSDRGVVIGNGVFVKNITRSHDKFLEKQINISNQLAGSASAKHESLGGLERIFSPQLGASVSDEVTNFFNALQALSASPEEPGVRTNLREAAGTLVSSFRRVENELVRERRNINDQISTAAEDLSGKLARVAELNVAIGQMETGRQDVVANDLRDEQDRIVRAVSKEFDLNYYYDKNGLAVVRGPKDTLLVEGKFAAQVDVKASGQADSNRVVIANEDGKVIADVTEHISKGRLQSLVEVRDQTISDLLESNEDMARTFVDYFNGIHRQGFGINDYRAKSGRNFFDAGEPGKDFIKKLQVADTIMNSVDAISIASTPNAVGDNVIGNQLLRLREEPILSGQSANMMQFYSKYVGELAVDIRSAEQRMQAEDIVSADLSARRDSIAGVSIDEESVNLLKWQANFAASSKVITTTDEMMETVLNLKR
jgi:flagellar hook-associated protein 1